MVRAVGGHIVIVIEDLVVFGNKLTEVDLTSVHPDLLGKIFPIIIEEPFHRIGIGNIKIRARSVCRVSRIGIDDARLGDRKIDSVFTPAVWVDIEHVFLVIPCHTAVGVTNLHINQKLFAKGVYVIAQLLQILVLARIRIVPTLGKNAGPG